MVQAQSKLAIQPQAQATMHPMQAILVDPMSRAQALTPHNPTCQTCHSASTPAFPLDSPAKMSGIDVSLLGSSSPGQGH
jgi:hypothetical protein